MKRIKSKVLRFLKLIYVKLCRINDSPQKIAQGFGLGVFLGVMPGVGVIAALVLASLLRMNRASAVIGTLLTNTWFTFVIFFLSIRTGAVIMGRDWHEVHRNWVILLKDFHWAALFKSSCLDVILPIAAGYLVISLFLAALSYAAVLAFITQIRHAKNKSRINLPR